MNLTERVVRLDVGSSGQRIQGGEHEAPPADAKADEVLVKVGAVPDHVDGLRGYVERVR
jgi:hypothetical protein